MAKPRPQVADDLKPLLQFIQAGQLFAVQTWIQSGQRIRDPENQHTKFCPLHQAVAVGFHSLVEVLLRPKVWSQHELDSGLAEAMSAGRMDLVDLLLAAGAQASAIDFEDVCRTVDPLLMERFLRLGVDPARGNAFARALDDIKARPLLAFYRKHRDEFPVLHQQASLALVEAVEAKKHRWTALLAWAGADPFMRVPDRLYDDEWETDSEGWGRTAADNACWSEDPELVKVLKFRPTPEQAQELLRRASWFPNPAIITQLLKFVPVGTLNAGERQSCAAVEHFISRHSDISFYGEHRGRQKDEAAAACLEILLDAGARWHPEPDNIGSIRRSLSKHASHYIVRVIRLLIYTPGAADPDSLNELLRTPTIRAKIATADPKLAKELATFGRSFSASDT